MDSPQSLFSLSMHYASFRALTPSFRSHMERHGAWPRERLVANWFKLHYGGYAGNSFTALKRGDLVLEKYVLGFIALLAAHADAPDVRHSYRSLLQFLDRPLSYRIDAPQVERVAGLVCGPQTDAPLTAHKHSDYLSLGVRALGDYQGELGLSRHVRRVKDESVLARLVSWNLQRVAVSAVPGAATLAAPECEAAACEYLGVSKPAYVRAASGWLACSPWCLVDVVAGSASVGVSAVLPLRDGAYDDVRAGVLRPVDLRAKHLCCPSYSLLLEAASEAPDSARPASANATKPLFLSLAYQVAALARCERASKPETLRLLAYASSPQIRARALATGFVPTGTRTAHTGMELLERELTVGALPTDDSLEVPLVVMLGHLAPEAPPA